jgi:hypothetical protein
MKNRHNRPSGSVIRPDFGTMLKGRCHKSIPATRKANRRDRGIRRDPSRSIIGGLRRATGSPGRVALEEETPPRLRTQRLPGRSLSRTRRLGGPMVLAAKPGPGTTRHHGALQSILHPLPWRRRPGRPGHPRHTRFHRSSLAVIAFGPPDRQYPLGRPRRRHADVPRDVLSRRDVGDVPLSPDLRPWDRNLASRCRPCRRSSQLRRLGTCEFSIIIRRSDLGPATAPGRRPAGYGSALMTADMRVWLDLRSSLAWRFFSDREQFPGRTCRLIDGWPTSRLGLPPADFRSLMRRIRSQERTG